MKTAGREAVRSTAESVDENIVAYVDEAPLYRSTGWKGSEVHLQGYLNFFSLTLNTDHWFEKILATDFYN